MSTAARKARKRAGEQFQHPHKDPPTASIVNALFTPDGKTRPAADVERDLARIGTSIREVHHRMGLDSKPQPRARIDHRRRGGK